MRGHVNKANGKARRRRLLRGLSALQSSYPLLSDSRRYSTRLDGALSFSRVFTQTHSIHPLSRGCDDGPSRLAHRSTRSLTEWISLLLLPPHFQRRIIALKLKRKPHHRKGNATHKCSLYSSRK